MTREFYNDYSNNKCMHLLLLHNRSSSEQGITLDVGGPILSDDVSHFYQTGPTNAIVRPPHSQTQRAEDGGDSREVIRNAMTSTNTISDHAEL